MHAFFKRYSYYTISITFKVTYFSSKPNIYFLEERVCLLKLHLKRNINMLQTKLLSLYLRLQPVITTFIHKIDWHNESLCLFVYTLPFDQTVIYFYMEECVWLNCIKLSAIAKIPFDQQVMWLIPLTKDNVVKLVILALYKDKHKLHFSNTLYSIDRPRDHTLSCLLMRIRLNLLK